ncbi:hypothetical protein PPACK8108_LOCUS9861 [Phakopsora pachyrhizi]|uniref:Uncharacterized protein n=1 Tax=Phakopsora pachyrhizi TaxID=170000 RepID=A0AAV0AXC6_PHAPC|nr:hypothetical protein PPACK8108_LOCUS9861 [Phakopsora pachyrhizi]
MIDEGELITPPVNRTTSYLGSGDPDNAKLDQFIPKQLRGVGNSSNKANPIVFETMTGQKKGLAIVVVDLFHLKLSTEQVKSKVYTIREMEHQDLKLAQSEDRSTTVNAPRGNFISWGLWRTLPRMPLRMGRMPLGDKRTEEQRIEDREDIGLQEKEAEKIVDLKIKNNKNNKKEDSKNNKKKKKNNKK